MSRPNFATTYALEPESFTPGFRKKKFVRQTQLAHYVEPSKFWELAHGSVVIQPTDPRRAREKSYERGRIYDRVTGGDVEAARQMRRSSSAPPSNSHGAVSKWAHKSLADFVGDGNSAFSRYLAFLCLIFIAFFANFGRYI